MNTPLEMLDRIERLEAQVQAIHAILDSRMTTSTAVVNAVTNRLLVLEAQCEQCLLLCRADSALERKDVE